MFWSALIYLSLAASTIASPYKRAEGVSVNIVPTAASIDRLDELKFTAFVTNNGMEPVRILKYATILDGELPTRSFEVSKGGNPVKFTGVKLFMDLKKAGESAYTIINAGQTLDIVHDSKFYPSVGGLYDFSSAGVGKYSFKPITDFLFVNDDAQTKNVKRFFEAEVVSFPVEVEITGGLESRKVDSLASRAVPNCPDEWKSNFIASSYTESQQLAQIAVKFLQENGGSSSGSGLFGSYFGNSPVSQVTSVLNAVAQENNATKTLNCEDPHDYCLVGALAYSLLGDVYHCSPFFDELPLGSICTGTIEARNSRGETVLHELTHALSNTKDVRYGCAENQKLSPSQSVINADSYECFAVEVYKATQCGNFDLESPEPESDIL